MHKTIIALLAIALIVGCGLLIGQSALHDIDKNTRIRGFLVTWGSVYPVWDAKYNLGKENNRWDTLFVEHIDGLDWGYTTFEVEATADTVEIIGVTDSSLFWLQPRGSDLWKANWGYECWIDTLVIYCAEDDTSLAHASGINYWWKQ
jgi:hypothetical protein